MSVKIVTVAKQLPKYSSDTVEILPMLDTWLYGQETRFIKKVKKIFEGAAVNTRYSIMDPIEVFTATSFEDKNNIYSREVIILGEQVLEKALKKAGWDPSTLDYIITVSCTGIIIPSLDAYLINKLKLRQDIVRLPVTEMGCVAGVSGLLYAKNFLKGNPNKRAAVIAIEAPTATFQLDDFSMSNIVSAAIFGDGAACCLLSSYEEDYGPNILDEQMYHFFNMEHIMGFKLTNSGLKMILGTEVPDTIAQHFGDIIHPFLKKNNLEIRNIDHMIFHPGGKKIVMTVEKLFSEWGKNIDHTKEILLQYGNMSSATVLYVLERVMDKNPIQGELGLMLSFGPGFSAQGLLLKW
ncbi:type III polyketide synthase [Sphingobacterium kitahiroshimense]|uniref:type III polyketide synthase n=1 Tax=Sphingobacterium sp. B16(2022) TaxID=2914044 RepID=UPI00143B83E7|nr:type III polyketide synthase [Sphingobacterium sp. B16(2022)]NJI73007.1 type III polyketide synthase [Sphingobacterium sp. B16(2022)]